WMGYVGNFIAISTFIVLPFAGYYLGREIYQYNQQMGITMMGGFMSWLWIVQAVLIGVLFLAANYYLWSGMVRAVYQVDAAAPDRVLAGLGDPPHDAGEPGGNGRDGWLAPSLPQRA